MSKESNNALTQAYECVTALGWNHSRLSREYGIARPTLRRIRSGRCGKAITDEYCMKVFVSIIYQAYLCDLSETGGSRSSYFNRIFRDILFSLYGVGGGG